MLTRFSSLLLMVLISLSACNKSGDTLLPPADPEPAPLPNINLVLKPVTYNISANIGGYYQALPSNYDSTTDTYPVLIFLHGAGQFGNGKNELPRVLYYGTMDLLKKNMLPSTFTVDNKTTNYLLFAPQFKDIFSQADLDIFVDYITQKFRINRSRLYMAGLSKGGRLACIYAAAHPEKVAAFVSMAGGLADDGDREIRSKSIAEHNVPVWALHNDKDQAVPTDDSKIFISLVKSYNPKLEARLTILPPAGKANHDCWTRVCNPDFRENGKNIYEWLFQFSK